MNHSNNQDDQVQPAFAPISGAVADKSYDCSSNYVHQSLPDLSKLPLPEAEQILRIKQKKQRAALRALRREAPSQYNTRERTQLVYDPEKQEYVFIHKNGTESRVSAEEAYSRSLLRDPTVMQTSQYIIDAEEYRYWEEDYMTYSEKQETSAQPAFQVDDILDTLIAQASVPNLAALFKKAKGQGLIKPAYVYHQDS